MACVCGHCACDHWDAVAGIVSICDAVTAAGDVHECECRGWWPFLCVVGTWPLGSVEAVN